MRDHINGNYVMLRSKQRIALDKHLLDAMKEAGIKFKINARV